MAAAKAPGRGSSETGTRIAELEAQLEERNTELATRNAELAKQNAKIMELEELVQRLGTQVELLTETLSRNSTNSNRPPSSDGPGADAGGGSKKSKKGSERKRGGQKGHRGAHRLLAPAEQVDAVVDLFPKVCLGCGELLPENADLDAVRYQQIDLHEHRPRLTEWRRHEVSCPHCGAKTKATYDPGVIPSSAFGPCLTAVVALLTGVYHLSRRQAQRLLLELFGISVSLGALSAMERRASEALLSAYEEAASEVEYAAVKHTDATSWLKAGALMSLWTLACVSATLYRIFDNGRRETVRSMFGPLIGILVSDRASVFVFWSMRSRQICWSHLLRKFISFSERDGPAGSIGRELIDLTALVFDYWHGHKDGVLTRDELAHWLNPVQKEIERLLERGAKLDIARFSGACADILGHHEALWTFVTQEGVEPTNNHAEQELRSFVLWRKRSFGSQSNRGDRFAERVMTVAHTARKQCKAVLQFLVDSVKAHLSGQMPPKLIEADV